MGGSLLWSNGGPPCQELSEELCKLCTTTSGLSRKARKLALFTDAPVQVRGAPWA